MNIQTLAPRAPERALATAHKISSQEAAPPLDFSSIDTPQEAALLPYMEPTFQLALATGVAMAAAAASQNGPVPHVAIDTLFEAQNQEVRVSFELRLGDQLPLRTEGHVGAEPVDQRLELAPDWKSACLTGTIGANPVELDLDMKGESFEVSGQMGKVETRLEVTPVLNGKGWVQGVISRGTLGGVPYEVQSKFTQDGHLIMEGDLDGKPMERNCHAFGEIVSGTFYLAVSGEGRDGELPVRASSVLTVKFPESAG